MSWLAFKYPIYFLLLFATFILGCMKWMQLQRADRVFTLLVGLTILQEIVAYLSLKAFKNNMFTYHIYSPLEFFLLCCYFNERSNILKRKNMGIALGVFGIIVSICNTKYFQPLKTFNSYYLLFEGTFIILLCLLSLYEILLGDILDFKKQSFFWITLSLMFYWSMTYTGWGIFSILELKKSPILKISEVVLYFSNLLFYAAISFIFINYKKLIPPAT